MILRVGACLVFFFSALLLMGQDLELQIAQKKEDLIAQKKKIEIIKQEIEELKLQTVIRDLKSIGLPSDDFIEHSAMILSYSDQHKQANWVMHIILPDVVFGSETRSNNFREDPKIPGGTAVEEDYFLSNVNEDGTTSYDGFGFDRGHLAPSADFRWSPKALSESYYYSNISPQVESLNREKWRELEDALRNYIYQNPSSKLFVFTAPVLHDDLPFIERSRVNKVSIPQKFVKAVVDLDKQRGIAFVMENDQALKALSEYAVSIDAVEELLGLDLFKMLGDDLENKLEAQSDTRDWFISNEDLSYEVLSPDLLSPGQYNTKMALQKRLSGKKATVCGTLVSHRYSRKGNYWVNLDAAYPNAHFSFWIRKENLVNIGIMPHKIYMNERVCVEGTIKNYGDNVSIEIKNENKVTPFQGK